MALVTVGMMAFQSLKGDLRDVDANLRETITATDIRLREAIAATDANLKETITATDIRLREAIAATDANLKETIIATDARLRETITATDARLREAIIASRCQAEGRDQRVQGGSQSRHEGPPGGQQGLERKAGSGAGTSTGSREVGAISPKPALASVPSGSPVKYRFPKLAGQRQAHDVKSPHQQIRGDENPGGAAGWSRWWW